MERLFNICVFEVLLYLGLFILRPFTVIEDEWSWIWTLIPIIYFIVVCSYACISQLYKFIYWLIGLPVMWFLICLYHPTGIYGLSNSTFEFSIDYKFDLTFFRTDALLFSIMLLVAQTIILVIVKIFNLYKLDKYY